MPFTPNLTNRFQPAGHATSQPPTGDLWREESGNAAAEYAVLLALIVGIVLMGNRFLGEVGEESFSAVASTLGDGHDRDHHADSAASEEPHESSPASTEAPSAQAGNGLRLLMAELVSIAALGGLWYYMRVCRRQRTEEAADELPASVSKALPHNRLYAKRQEIYRILTNNMSALFASRMHVAHVMSRNVTRVSQETSTEEIRAKMREKQFRHLLVCGTNGRLKGIISDRDIAERDGATASALMTPDPLTVPPTMHISMAVTLMLENRISCLPVIDDEGDTVGVLTSTDLMMTLQCALQLLQKVAAEVDEGAEVPAAPVDAAAATDEHAASTAAEIPDDRLVATH